jgi:hypothetical protein
VVLLHGLVPLVLSFVEASAVEVKRVDNPEGGRYSQSASKRGSPSGLPVKPSVLARIGGFLLCPKIFQKLVKKISSK